MRSAMPSSSPSPLKSVYATAYFPPATGGQDWVAIKSGVDPTLIEIRASKRRHLERGEGQSHRSRVGLDEDDTESIGCVGAAATGCSSLA